MKLRLIFPVFFIILTTGCSIKYKETPVVDDKVPEFLFTDATMVRYNDKNIAVEVNASELEQYRNSSESYGKDVSFISYDDGKVDTKGSCSYVYANSDAEMYELYDNISLDNFTEELRVTAEALKWNGKTEQLTSSRGDAVKIEKEDTTLRGTGFAASGVSKSFSFSGNVIGNVETKDNEKNNPQPEGNDGSSAGVISKEDSKEENK